MKFKLAPMDDDGLVFIEINVPFCVGPQTMAKFLKLMEFSHPFKKPDEWKIRDLMWHLKNEIKFSGRTRIDKTEVSLDEEPLYFGCVEKYFPELKR